MAPVFGYWKIRGLAQPVRLLYAYLGIEFEDKHYVERDEWMAEKFTIGLDFPNLPYLIDGDLKMTQSVAILKYIAQKNNLDATTDAERLQLDILAGVLFDMRLSFGMVCYNPEFEKLKVEYLKNLPVSIEQMAKYIGDKTWLLGEKITYMDFVCYEMLDVLKVFEPTCLDKHQNLQNYQKRFEELPAIAAYMKSDKFISYPINGAIAFWGGK